MRGKQIVRDVPKDARNEFKSLSDPLKETNGKRLDGHEYTRLDSGLYIGWSMGPVAEAIFTNGELPILNNPSKDVFTYLERDSKEPIEHANYIANSWMSRIVFEGLQRHARGFDVPFGGPILLELQRGFGKELVNEGENGYRLEEPIELSELSRNCKLYILEQLGLGKFSFAYQTLFK